MASRLTVRSVLTSLAIFGAGLAAAPSALATADLTTSTTATPAVAYQLNPAHTGVTGDAMAASPTKRWAVNFTGAVSYPLVTPDRVFVTVANPNSYGTQLYAFNAVTGAKDWGPIPLYGTYYWSGLAFDKGRVFTVNENGVMEAFNALTGERLWSVQLPGQYSFSSPPTAFGGYVYTGGAGSGGTLYAVNEATGALVWNAGVMNGDHSSPAVSSSGVYVSYACGQTYDFNPLTGAPIWHRSTPCEGGGGKTPVLAGGRLYVRDFSYAAMLDASSGAFLSPFASSGPAPAVDAKTIYDLAGSTLTATNVTSGATDWSFAGDGTLSSAPLEAAGTVFVGGTSGELYALSSATGQVTWSTNVGAPITAPDEQNAVELSGMAESAGLLVVAASDELVAYR